MFVAPFAFLLIWANLFREYLPDLLAVALAALIGIAGLATANWKPRAKAIVAIAYLGFGTAALPFATLLVVCTTGDCI
jgi:hypothetical protein